MESAHRQLKKIGAHRDMTRVLSADLRVPNPEKILDLKWLENFHMKILKPLHIKKNLRVRNPQICRENPCHVTMCPNFFPNCRCSLSTPNSQLPILLVHALSVVATLQSCCRLSRKTSSRLKYWLLFILNLKYTPSTFKSKK